jgi:hypothetical protein
VLNAFKDFKDMCYHVSTRLFLSWILTLHVLGFSWSSNVGCIHNLKSQGCQGKCSFQKIACDMWHSCIGLLFQILHISCSSYKSCVRFFIFFLLHLDHMVESPIIN